MFDSREFAETYAAENSEFRAPDDLLRLYSEIKNGTLSRDWGKQGNALEYLILRAFHLEGAEVRPPFEVGGSVEGQFLTLEEIDGAVYVDGLPPCLVEAKDQKKRVNYHPIGKFRDCLRRRPRWTLGLFFSKSDYTRPAVELVRPVPSPALILWYFDEIEFGIANGWMIKGLIAKHRCAVERAFFDYHLKAEQV